MITADLTPLPLQSPMADTMAVVVAPGPLAVVQSVSIIVLGAATLLTLVAVLILLLQLRKLLLSLGTVAKTLETRSAPVMERAKSAAENVEFVTMAVRTDVQKLTGSVSSLNDRLKEASLQMEERIKDFSALVEVLQSEAEELALDTAAAVRGVRAGTRNLAESRGPMADRSPPGPVEGIGRGFHEQDEADSGGS